MAQIADTCIGFELECAELKLKYRIEGTGEDYDPTKLDNPKGKPLYVFTLVDKKYTRINDLELSDATSGLIATAEIPATRDTIDRTEFIYGGVTGAILTPKTDRSAYAGFRILQYLAKWNLAARNPDFLKTIRVQAGGDPNNPMGDPKNLAIPSASFQFTELPRYSESVPDKDSRRLSLHMTVGFPLAGFVAIIQDTPLNKAWFYGQPLPINPVSEDFERLCKRYDDCMAREVDPDSIWRSGITPEYGRDTALGFLIIAQSYVYSALVSPTKDNSLKLQVPLMPRTDFRTMLRIVLGLMTSDKARWAFRDGLPLMLEPRDSRDKLDDLKWAFSSPKSEDITMLLVYKWIADLDENSQSDTSDMLTQFDRKYRNGQIGGLGNKVERILDQSASAGSKAPGDGFLCPIIEFRSLQPLAYGNLTGQETDLWASKDPGNVVFALNGSSALQVFENRLRKMHSNVFQGKMKKEYFQEEKGDSFD